jgi:Tfp pilus assembly protein PilW
MHLPRAILPPQRPAAAGGFTLVELLITAVVGSLVIGAITTLQLSELRATTAQDLSLQQRQEANRAAAWIDSEISRASGFDNTVAASCSAPAGTSLRFSVRTQPNAGAVREVSFFSPTGTAVGNVARCGPPVVCTANTACALDLAAANVTYLVASNARLDVTSPLDGTARRTLTYTVTTRPGVVAPDITRQAFAGAPGASVGSEWEY